MLEHYFWLLEFKFKFEFHCLNPFSKIKYLNPIPKTPTPFPLPAPACAVQQQPSSAAGRRSRPRPSQRGPTQQLRKPARASSRAPAHLAFRPKPVRGNRRPALPLPLRLTCGVRWSSPTPHRPPPELRRRRPSPSEARFPVRGPHTKESARDYLRPPPPPRPPTRDTRRPPPPAPHPAKP
jgi:hypothetical protein